MLAPVVVDLAGDLDWVDFEIPASNPPVRLATLRVEPSRGRTVLVRFPAGWERPEAGSYSCAEEMVLLQGTLEMSGARYDAWDWAYVPRRAERAATRARSEVLALARFDGPARWNAEASQAGEILRRGLEVGPGALPSPLGEGRAWSLRRGAADSTWLLDAPPAGEVAPSAVEVLALRSRRWASVRAGEPLPDLDGLCFCRTFDGEC